MHLTIHLLQISLFFLNIQQAGKLTSSGDTAQQCLKPVDNRVSEITASFKNNNKYFYLQLLIIKT